MQQVLCGSVGSTAWRAGLKGVRKNNLCACLVRVYDHDERRRWWVRHARWRRWACKTSIRVNAQPTERRILARRPSAIIEKPVVAYAF